jgi:hypothetical protein
MGYPVCQGDVMEEGMAERAMAELAAGEPPPATVVQRVRGIVASLDLDCACRTKLDGALQRFEALEDRRQFRRLILDGRNQVERIAALLDLARELDELTMDEPDLSVFEEIALLFEGMRDAAARGANDMRAARHVRAPAGPVVE